MKTKEIAAKYGINGFDFDRFLMINNLPHKGTFTGAVVADENVERYVCMFLLNDADTSATIEELKQRVALKQKKAEEERKRAEIEDKIRQIEEAKKKAAMAEMLITSGFNFDGYKITKYSGYISGDDAISVDRGYSWENVSVRDELMASLAKIRRNALRELKEAAYDLGCNAVIGVDFDYITLDPQTANSTGGTTYQPYVFCVTANGNAVIIEKTDE